MKAFKSVFIVLLISMLIAIFWDSIPAIKDTVHSILDPILGKLLDYNVNIGMIVISALITLFITIIQKYTIDNETLAQLKKEQKIIAEDMKKLKDNPEKVMGLQKESLAKAGEIFTLSMKSFGYTAIPIILFFRWFADYFAALDPPVKIFGFFSWFWAYLIFSIIFSIIFRKMFKLP